jgi:hypothetical protein
MATRSLAGQRFVALALLAGTTAALPRPARAEGPTPIEELAGAAPTLYRIVFLVDPTLPAPGQVTILAGRGLRLALVVSDAQDYRGAPTSHLGASAEWRGERLTISATIVAAHTLLPGADDVDVDGTVAATLRLAGGVRLGVQARATDVEEVLDAGAEGGASAFVGPTLGWALDGLQVTGGPAFGVLPGSSGAVAMAHVNATIHF